MRSCWLLACGDPAPYLEVERQPRNSPLIHVLDRTYPELAKATYPPKCTAGIHKRAVTRAVATTVSQREGLGQ